MQKLEMFKFRDIVMSMITIITKKATYRFISGGGYTLLAEVF